MIREMSNETFLLDLPRVVTPWRLARRLVAPTALAAIATGFAVVGIVTTYRPAGAAAVAWAAGAILLMRPDEHRLALAFREADRRLRTFLVEHAHLRGKKRTRAFFDLINPLDSEASWQALVALNLPRGGWSFLALPALLAATALVSGATLLLAPFSSPLVGLLLAVVAFLSIALGFDAYASTVRSVLGEPAAEAATELRRTLAVMAAVDDALVQLRAVSGDLPSPDTSTDLD
jgi:hypothetical protein